MVVDDTTADSEATMEGDTVIIAAMVHSEAMVGFAADSTEVEVFTADIGST
jgi:hypothetical protein